MLEILRHTPHWVYTAFTLVIYFGLQSCFEVRARVSQLMVVPVLVAAVSLGLNLRTHGLSADIFGGWSAGVLGATTATYSLTLATGREIRRDADDLVIPGGCAVLSMGLAAFAVKFFFGYHIALGSAWTLGALYDRLDALSSGIISGFFLGRALAHLVTARRLGAVSRIGGLRDDDA